MNGRTILTTLTWLFAIWILLSYGVSLSFWLAAAAYAYLGPILLLLVLLAFIAEHNASRVQVVEDDEY